MERLTMTGRLALGIAAAALATSARAHTLTADPGTAYTIVTIKVDADRTEMKRLIEEGFEIAGVDRHAGTVDVLTHTTDEGLGLRFRGFHVTTSREIDASKAPDSNYKTFAEIKTILDGYAKQYPNLARVSSIGKTGEGRDIWALKISTNPDQHDATKPAVLFNGMHHAREVMSPEVVLDTAEQLLSGYGSNTQVTKWVDTSEIWLIPMFNVDGNNKVWNGNSMWRKNTRGGYGVDINRNYPYLWNTCNGSSSSTGADDYHGPSAGSEPETQAMMAFVSRIQPVFDISYHSYSELVIYPYGCEGTRSETKEIVEPIGQAMAAKLPSEDGKGTYSPGTAWELLYDVDGDDISWMYHEQHVIPYVIELNSGGAGFQPPFSLRQPTVEKLRGAWSIVLDRLSGSGVRGLIRDGSGRAQPSTIVTATSSTGKAAPITWPAKADGSYHIVLNPGMYKLTFELQGRTITKDVTIGAERVDLDIEI